MSIGEYKKYTQFSKKLDIEFKREFTFQDFKSENLRFDFGININDDNYLLIEFDGKQHFQKVKCSNCDQIRTFNPNKNMINKKDEYVKKITIMI